MPTIAEQNLDPVHDRLAGRLPLMARRKMERWREAEDEAAALIRSDMERAAELKVTLGKVMREAAELERADAAGKLFHDKADPDPSAAPGSKTFVRERDTARLDAARAAVQRIEDQLDRLNQRRAERGGTPLSYVEAYLRSLRPGTEFSEYDGPAAKPHKGETFFAAVERTRAAIRDLRDEAKSVDLAPHPVSAAKAKARAEIERLANHGRPELLALVERGGSIRWPTFPLRGVALTEGHIPQIPDTWAALAWLFKDQLIAALDREIDEFGDDEGALSAEDRAKRLREIAGEVLALEYAEESFIEKAEAEGAVIARRSDADPRALLGLAASLPPFRRAA